ncbi:hypothetical protein SGRIM128S_09385 [Streptomyces griseomycini]
MRGGQRVHDLGAGPGRLAGIEGAALAEHVVQGRPVDRFHDDQRAPVHLGDVVHGDDAGVPHPGRRACLALHPQAEIGQFGTGRVGVGAQFLHRHLAAENLVHRLPDHAHATASEPRRDPVTAGQHPAGSVRVCPYSPADTATPFP